MSSYWGVTPRESVLAEVRQTGRHDVAARCMAILTGGRADGRFLYVLAGPASRPVLDGQAGGASGFWPKVWALRGLRYAWEDEAHALVIAATQDESWRVREMAAKVIGVHLVDDGLEALDRLTGDPVPRVRAAAVRARISLTEGSSPGSRSLSRNQRGRRRQYE